MRVLLRPPLPTLDYLHFTNRLLEAIRANREIDTDFSGGVSVIEFRRLGDPAVICRAEASLADARRAKVEGTWEALAKLENGEVDRSAAWAHIYSDDEFVGQIGEFDLGRGKK